MLRADLPATERRALLIEVDSLLEFGLAAYARPPAEALPPEALRLIEQRDAARRDRQWARSDELRAELLALGVESQDSREGSVYLRIV
jgi:cysteinyl-tRNA synthetase